jgi:hypothetical protein
VRVVQPPGHVSGAGDPVNQEVVTIADSQGNLLDATLAKLLNIDIALTALRDAVRGTR